jgi:hypothetical protein
MSTWQRTIDNSVRTTMRGAYSSPGTDSAATVFGR